LLTVTLDDAGVIEVDVQGQGPTLLLPVDPTPVEGPQAEEMRKWGADPALGRSLIEGLRDTVRPSCSCRLPYSGVRSGVNGTPTFFINGLRHDDSYEFETLLLALKRAAEIGGEA
jgi:hypothetical protein